MGIAWKHRAENPVIIVRTLANDVESGLHPKLTMMPRAAFEACEDITYDCRNSVKLIMGQSNFSPETLYAVALEAKHPGSENWPCGLVGMRLHMADKECLEIVAALASAGTNEDVSLAVARAQELRTARLHTEVYVRRNLAALSTSGGDDRVIRCVRAMGYDCRVRLAGLVSAAHLNGREGSIMVRSGVRRGLIASHAHSHACTEGTHITH